MSWIPPTVATGSFSSCISTTELQPIVIELHVIVLMLSRDSKRIWQLALEIKGVAGIDGIAQWVLSWIDICLPNLLLGTVVHGDLGEKVIRVAGAGLPLVDVERAGSRCKVSPDGGGEDAFGAFGRPSLFSCARIAFLMLV